MASKACQRFSNICRPALSHTRPSQSLSFTIQGNPVLRNTFATKPIPRVPRRSYPSGRFERSLSTQAATSSSVAVPIDGAEYQFSPLLLRDLCECPACVHESTKQRLYSTADIPRDIAPRSVSLPDSGRNALGISWDRDVPGFDPHHRTEVDIGALRTMVKSGALPGPFNNTLGPQTLWDAESCTLPDFDYNDYMQDDATLHQALTQLRSHGLVFLTNVPGIEKSVSTIAERIGPVKDTFYGYTWDVRTVPSAINAAYTSQDLGFHTDLLYTHNPPHIQLLHCIQSSSVGGASVFTDAYKSASDLYDTDPDAFNTLTDIPVNYHYKHPDSNLYYATKPVMELRPLRVGGNTYDSFPEFLQAWENKRLQINKNRSGDAVLPPLRVVDCLEKVNWGPPFQAPFTLQEESMEQASLSVDSAQASLNRKVDTWHAAAKKLSALLHRPETLHERLMKPGECVLFDNTRVLHGRKAFNASDAGKARWLRGTYVDKDPYLSKLRVLKHQHESSCGATVSTDGGSHEQVAAGFA